MTGVLISYLDLISLMTCYHL